MREPARAAGPASASGPSLALGGGRVQPVPPRAVEVVDEVFLAVYLPIGLSGAKWKLRDMNGSGAALLRRRSVRPSVASPNPRFLAQ